CSFLSAHSRYTETEGKTTMKFIDLSRESLLKYAVNREGWEVIKQTLYDFQPYDSLGHNQLTFFALPLGRCGKTLSDTNMTLAGQLPTNQEFLVTSCEVHFYPSTPTPSGPTALPADGAESPASLADIVNDTYIFYRSGNLQMIVGSKPYLQEAPL